MLIVFSPVVGMGAVRSHHVLVDLLYHGEFKPLTVRLLPAGEQDKGVSYQISESKATTYYSYIGGRLYVCMYVCVCV